MSLSIQKTGLFESDLANQFAWYLDEAGEELARGFKRTVDSTLSKLAQQPDLGRIRRFRSPKLKNLRSFRIDPPFTKLLLFYRVERDVLQVVRLMHGARDLPRRLVELPAESED